MSQSGPNDLQEDELRQGRITINDIARLARVSKKTVSRVINQSPHVREATRAKVNAVIRETRFTPDPQARALAFRRSLLIGLVYDNPSAQYIVEIQQGVLDALDETSLQLVLRPVERNLSTTLETVRSFVLQQRPMGVIMPPSVSEDEAIAELLRELECPHVRIASVELGDPAFMIRSHDAEGAAQAARHLASLGHKRIAHIRGPSSFRSSHERLAGFRRGLAEFGVDLTDDMVVGAAYTFDSGVVAAQQLLYSSNRPTAIFAGNDEMAMGVYVAARKAGLRIPNDLSIIGYDDAPMASAVWPPMTTIASPIRDTGRAAARRLIEQTENVSPTAMITFTPKIVVRESTAPPN